MRDVWDDVEKGVVQFGSMLEKRSAGVFAEVTMSLPRQSCGECRTNWSSEFDCVHRCLAGKGLHEKLVDGMIRRKRAETHRRLHEGSKERGPPLPN